MSNRTGRLSTLTAEQLKAYKLSMSIGTYEKAQAYQEILLEKWSSVATGDGGTFDWLGADSTSAGFPEIKTDAQKAVVAVMLENQLDFQRSRRRRVVDGWLDEVPSVMADTQTSDEALPTNFALAMVRRAYALMETEDWSVRQPMNGPTAFVYFLDFLREKDPSGSASNLLSNYYDAWKTAEAASPRKGKVALKRVQVTANKQLLATTWTLEAEEDALAQLGLNIEQALIGEFTNEFVRDRFHQHLAEILDAAKNATAEGTSLPSPWSQAGQTALAIPSTPTAAGVTGLQEWSRAIFNALVDADVNFLRLNRTNADGVVCGLTMAGVLQKAITAVQSSNPTSVNSNDLGITDYGTFSGRFHVWGTDLLPDNEGFLYRRNADTLRQGHIYAPYVPIQAMPRVNAGYSDPSQSGTGAYLNTDEYTRNIRERSASVVVKPYAFTPLVLS